MGNKALFRAWHRGRSHEPIWTFKVGPFGVAIAFTAAPTYVAAETLQVMQGSPSSALQVPMSRAVVVESDTPFSQLSIADPNIADISSLSERTIYVLGKLPGRTT